jgi:hypothetical protein
MIKNNTSIDIKNKNGFINLHLKIKLIQRYTQNTNNH